MVTFFVPELPHDDNVNIDVMMIFAMRAVILRRLEMAIIVEVVISTYTNCGALNRQILLYFCFYR